MNDIITATISKLQRAQELFNADKSDKRIIDLLTDAAGLMAEAIQEAEGQNPLGSKDAGIHVRPA